MLWRTIIFALAQFALPVIMVVAIVVCFLNLDIVLASLLGAAIFLTVAQIIHHVDKWYKNFC